MLLLEKLCILEESPHVVVNSNLYDSIRSCVILELKLSGSHFKVKVNLKGRKHNASRGYGGLWCHHVVYQQSICERE